MVLKTKVLKLSPEQVGKGLQRHNKDISFRIQVIPLDACSQYGE